MHEGQFHCFTRFQQRVIQTCANRPGWPGRVTNRCFTDAPLVREAQQKTKRHAMTEAEASAVVKLTGHKCFLEEKFA